MTKLMSPFWGRLMGLEVLGQGGQQAELGGSGMTFGKMKTAAMCVAASIVALAPVAATATTSYDAQPVPSAAQTVSWDRGVGLFESTQPHGKVAAKYLQYDGGKLFFLIDYKNLSDAAVDFGVEQITVHDADGSAIKIYSRDELIRGIKRARDTKKFFAILGATAGVLATVAASQRTSTGTATDNYGHTYNYIERHTDGAILTAGTAASVGVGALVLVGANKNSREKINYLNENYLSRQTLSAGKEVYGVVEVDVPKIKNGEGFVDINLNISGDVHILRYSLRKN